VSNSGVLIPATCLLAQAYQSVSLVLSHAVYMGFTGVHHALCNLAPAEFTLSGTATLSRELSQSRITAAPRHGRFASADLDGWIFTT